MLAVYKRYHLRYRKVQDQDQEVLEKLRLSRDVDFSFRGGEVYAKIR